MCDTSGDDDYEEFQIGTSFSQGALANLYQDQGKKSSSNTSPKSSNSCKGIKLPILPPVKKSNGNVSKSDTGAYSLTQLPKVKRRVNTQKKQDKLPSTPKPTPKIGPKPKAQNSVESQEKPTVTSSDDGAIYEQMDPDIVPGEMTLEEFVKNFGHTLPQQIIVSRGMYGINDDNTLSTSDMCNVHTVIKRDLVRIEEKGSKQTYSIPLNSSIKFGPVFNHQASIEQIKKGERFPYVSNILDLVIMPKVVCACQPYDPNDFGSTEFTEILAIKEVIHAESGAQGRKLRVYSFTDGCDKVLDESMCGDFSTRPSDIKLHMHDILKHVISPFPMHLMMFKDYQAPKMMGIGYHLYQYPLFMTKKFTEIILLASNAHHHCKTGVFEIPTTIDIDIQLVKLPEVDHKNLAKSSEELMEKLGDTEVRIYKYENMNDEMVRTQTKLYQLVRTEKENPKPATRTRPAENRSLVQRIEKLEKTTQKFAGSQESLKTLREANEQIQNDLRTKIDSQEKLISQQATQLKVALHQITLLKKQVINLTKTVSGSTNDMFEDDDFEVTDPRPEDAQGESDTMEYTNLRAKENRHKLASMDNQEILKLLKTIGLSQYEPAFVKEEITGELLLECDQDLIQTELGITSKLHQMKLMRIIQGQTDLP